MYKETPILIPINIPYDSVKLVAQKLLGSSGPEGTNSEDLQEWILKFWWYSKRLHGSVKALVDWLANKSAPLAAYNAFLCGSLIALDRNPGAHPVGVRETWRQFFSKIVQKVTGPESTMACQYDQLCTRIKARDSRYLGRKVNNGELDISAHIRPKRNQRDQLNWIAVDRFLFMAIWSSLCFKLLPSLIIAFFSERG